VATFLAADFLATTFFRGALLTAFFTDFDAPLPTADFFAACFFAGAADDLDFFLAIAMRTSVKESGY
jgi:hypothetical protein